MKKLMIITTILLMSLSELSSQINFEFKFGYSPASNPKTAYVLINRENPFQEFKFNMVHTKTQFFGGIGLNVRLKSPFFIEGGLMYTKKTSEFMMDYVLTRESEPDVQYMNESEHILMLPVNVGFSVGKFDLTSGFSAKTTISRSTELSHIDGFSSDGNKLKMGWQMGARYAIKRAFIGAEYQGSFNRVCEGEYVNNHSLAVMNIPGQWVFSVQYRL